MSPDLLDALIRLDKAIVRLNVAIAARPKPCQCRTCVKHRKKPIK